MVREIAHIHAASDRSRDGGFFFSTYLLTVTHARTHTQNDPAPTSSSWALPA